ncbi:hypothetical protein FOZ60_012414 [Perkinsus olseni]|uniref:Endonuclease/exonuclease/phosphatase domain-containing protein n=1 Tax=Perkinsus olseni TaxID=32597 RepID=A0A7J6NCS5_PEROL|nr:hypothetical protein FOZ60_012414 [Perkinsus olseni]
MPEPKMSTSTSTTSADTPGSLRLMSWNVAGWIRTAKLLVKYHGSITNYLSKHHVDILAVQESKRGMRPIGHTPPPSLASMVSALLYGEGVLVRDVLTRPFNDSRYDDEGRCLVTFHGDDVALVNVYVPNGGDLNMAPDPEDIWWEYRIIDVNRLLADPPKGILRVMRTREVVQVSPDRYRVKIEIGQPDLTAASECNRGLGSVHEASSSATGDGGVKTIYLGSASNSMLSLRSSYNLDLVVLEDGTVVKPNGWIEVDELFEMIRKVVAREWEFVNCSQPFRTGIVYTAPVFSDHVAVTALLQVDFQRPGKAQVDGEYFTMIELSTAQGTLFLAEAQASERLHEAQSHKEGRRPPKGNQDIAVFLRSMATKKKAEEECSGLGRPAAKAKKTRPAGIRRWLKQPVGSPTNDYSSSDDTAIGEPMKKKCEFRRMMLMLSCFLAVGSVSSLIIPGIR